MFHHKASFTSASQSPEAQAGAPCAVRSEAELCLNPPTAAHPAPGQEERLSSGLLDQDGLSSESTAMQHFVVYRRSRFQFGWAAAADKVRVLPSVKCSDMCCVRPTS